MMRESGPGSVLLNKGSGQAKNLRFRNTAGETKKSITIRGEIGKSSPI